MCPCAVNACVFQRVEVPPGKGRLPSSNRSGSCRSLRWKGSLGDPAKMQAVTQVNARRGLETLVVEADPTDTRGRPMLQRKPATNALCKSAGVESDSMHRRNAHEAREADDDCGGNRNGQPARARSGRSSNGANRCPSRWFTPTKGTPQAREYAFAADRPTSSEPMSPGPLVTAIASIAGRCGSSPASSRARRTTGPMVVTWARPASSGTTPPKARCWSIEDSTTDEYTCNESSTTEAAVSSQLVSMPRTFTSPA